MSYAMPGLPGPDAPKQRPTTVTAATWLLVAAAATYALVAVLGFSQAGAFVDVFQEAYAGTELEGTGEFMGMVTAIGAGVFNLLFAAGFVVLALLDYRGKNPARIVTWVIGGLALCCTGVGLVFAGVDTMAGTDINGGPDQAELERMLEEALPAWYNAATWTLTGISVIALLAALILLATPSANDFFRKPTPQAPPPPPYPQPPYPQG